MKLSRRAALRTIGGAGLAVAAGSVMAVSLESPAMAAQPNWRRCRKCSCLFYQNPDGSSLGYCAAGPIRAGLPSDVPHERSDFPKYSVLFMGELPGAPTVGAWKWCADCQQLWRPSLFGSSYNCPRKGLGHPSGSNHQTVFSSNYQVEIDEVVPATQTERGWRWCTGCRSLCLEDGGKNYPCAAGFIAGNVHQLDGTHEFRLRYNF